MDGSRIHRIPDFYDQLNALMERDKTFLLAPSLDALNDALYEFSPHGALTPTVEFHWIDHELSKQALSYETTLAWLQEKASQPDRFNQELIAQQINDLKTGKGKTYFEIILEIFADHPYVKLVLA
ncbi:ribonuclease inhibitor [Neomicrococcus lactis]